MKQQTAMQEMLSWLTSAINAKNKFPNEVDFSFTLEHLKKTAEELLQKEEEQIKQAVWYGHDNRPEMIHAPETFADNYFTQTYTQ